VGAASASLISYTTSAVAITLIASRLAHASLASFWIPRRSDITTMWATGIALLRRLFSRNPSNTSSEVDANDG